MTCILRFATVVRLDTLYNSNEKRNSCKCANKGRKPVAKVVPQSSTHHRIGIRNVCPEEVTGLDRIYNDPPWSQRKSRRTSGRTCTGRPHNTGSCCNCCDSQARIDPSCSGSNLRCSWCSSDYCRLYSRADMPRTRDAFCRRYNPPGTRRDTCLRHIRRKPFNEN